MDELRAEVQRYMQARSNSIAPEIDVNKLSSAEYQQLRKQLNRKTNNPFAFLQPTGWFKDEIQYDIDKRSDKSVPIVAHPLSFIELDKYGFGNLSVSVLALGGPYAVGQQLQIDWREPVRRVKRVEEEVSTKRGSAPGRLALGGAFEESLSEAAEKLDLAALKSAIQDNGVGDDDDDDGSDLEYGLVRSASRSGADIDGDIDYAGLVKNAKSSGRFASRRAPSKAKSSDTEAEDKEEKFKLVGLERLYTLLLFSTGSVGYGRASGDLLAFANKDSSPLSSIHDLLSTGIDVMHQLFPLLLALSVVNAARSALQAQSVNRNAFVWAPRAFLGGPGVLQSLKSLPPGPGSKVGV